MHSVLVSALTILLASPYTHAYPSLARSATPPKDRPQSSMLKRYVFDPVAQLVSTSGDHVFVAPGHGDLRGPCPGLNALANHNYLNHSGIIHLADAVQATNEVFGMGIDLATFLSAYATVIDGSPSDLTWSIGGAYTPSLASSLLGSPQGLSGSHNKYESDASPGRGDAYLHDGDASTLQVANFQKLYGLQPGDSEGDYNLDVLIQHASDAIDYSRANNPQFFWGPFTGVVVSQAAFSFIPAFMSNHSAENPAGFLDQTVLKSFFSISGTQNNLHYSAGHEKIPDNWYRRPIGDDYSIPVFSLDNNRILLEVPKRLAVGGNLGKAGSFAGVDVSDLTGGVYNAQSLAQGNNAFCFGAEALLTVVPDLLKTLVSDVADALNVVTQQIAPQISGLNCPQLNYYNQGLFAAYPGAGSAL